MIQGEKCLAMRDRYVKPEFIMRNYAIKTNRRFKKAQIMTGWQNIEDPSPLCDDVK